jgi:hypothetical protein
MRVGEVCTLHEEGNLEGEAFQLARIAPASGVLLGTGGLRTPPPSKGARMNNVVRNYA